MNKPRLTAEARKRAIVKAALPLFARRGFAETTTKDLARAAGVSEPLLYKHFPSKEALYLEIQEFTCRGIDPAIHHLTELEPSTSSLVHLIYYLMRALILGQPAGRIRWDTRHRLMIKSFLEDGTFARLLFRSRFDCFCARIEACLGAAIAAGDAVRCPITGGNRACFAHHVAAWIAMARLPRRPVINYKVSREELLHQAVWFALRGMGLTDQAIATHYNPKALALFFSGA
ncbi:MAG: TetR/AcrR family transcriptional regulator [Verrucomicrobia bacterium]|nr:TetR/AcrR family transcriptional regulator [Verrucomicrobiota bacterium]